MRKFVKGLTTVAALAMTASFAFAANVEVDATDYLDTDGNNTVYITDCEQKDGSVKEGLFDDASNLDKVYAVTYYFTLNDYSTVTNDDGVLDYAAWSGGAIGTNDNGTGWNSYGQWTTAVESKEYVLALPGADRDGANVDVSADGEVVLTIDVTGLYTTDEDEYATAWLQDYSDGNAGLVHITKVTVTVDESIAPSTLADDDTAADDTAADDTAADDTTTTEAPAATTDSSAATGDSTSVVALAGIALVALAGVVVSSKKRA